MRKSGTGVAIIPLFLFFFLAANLVFSSTLHAQAPFYQGKSIRLIIGSQAGSLYDLWARLIANHMGKHIAGNPGDRRAKHARRRLGDCGESNLQRCQTGWAHHRRSHFRESIWTSLSGERKCSSTGPNFSWIGTPEQTEWVFITRRDSPYKSIEDIRAATEPPKCGSTGTGSFLYLVPKLMEETLGTKLTMITGYQGGPDVDLAIERGEVHCRAVSDYSLFRPRALHYLGKKWICSSPRSDGRKREPSLTDVPTIYELMDQYKTPETGRRLATVILAANVFGRPILTPPGVPAERVKILREAWNRTVKDPELLAEAKREGWPVEPVSWRGA